MVGDDEEPTVGWSDPRWRTAGITVRRLDTWTVKGWLQTAGDATPGSGNYRRWPEAEIAVGARIAQLIHIGFQPALAARLARSRELGALVVDVLLPENATSGANR